MTLEKAAKTFTLAKVSPADLEKLVKQMKSNPPQNHPIKEVRGLEQYLDAVRRGGPFSSEYYVKVELTIEQARIIKDTIASLERKSPENTQSLLPLLDDVRRISNDQVRTW